MSITDGVRYRKKPSSCHYKAGNFTLIYKRNMITLFFKLFRHHEEVPFLVSLQKLSRSTYFVNFRTKQILPGVPAVLVLLLMLVSTANIWYFPYNITAIVHAFFHFILCVAGVPAIRAFTNAGVTALAGAYCVWQDGITSVAGVPSVRRRPSTCML
jgi:hypothetical protein